MIIRPPIVGVPFFNSSSGKSNFLIFSPICFFARKLIIFFPKIVEIKSAVIKVIADLKDKYWNKLAPAI